MKSLGCLIMFIIVSCNEGNSNVVVPRFESIVFEGCCPAGVHTKWVFNGTLLYFNKILRNKELGGNITISDNKSLTIGEISLSHEGIYECMCNDVLRANYSLKVEVPPKMYLMINEVKLDQAYHWVQRDEPINITCIASESRPAMNLTWVINNDEDIYAPIQSNTQDGELSTSTSVLYYQPKHENENISCIANGVASTVYHEEVLLHTYVLPELYITINGERVDENLSVEVGERMKMTCFAEGAKPIAKLSFNELRVSEEELYNGTTSISSYLVKGIESDIITCTSTQHRQNETDLKKKITILLEVSDESPTSRIAPSTDQPTPLPPSSGGLDFLQWMSPSIAALCLILFCSYKLIIKIRSSMSANLATSADCDTRGPSQIQMDSLPPTDQSLLQKSLHGSLREKQKSDLPSIPSDESNSLNSSGNSSESNYYSAAKERDANDRIFSEKDFCVLLNIKMGDIHNRWMGTIALSRDVNQCAVLTTIADGVNKKKVIQWDEFVKRTLDLPKTDHLTKIEGIGVDKTTLYLISEHIVCETLESRLTFDPSSQSTENHMVVPEVMKHISGILEGMEFIKSYGFLHPGLSTKKVLYSKEGICKLYDYCLADDASKIVSLKKAQMSAVTFNQFPPESIFRSEYSGESDVWSTAVVIWEILSRGTPPFPIDEGVKPGEDMKAPKLNWPQRYLQLSNLSLFDCWNETCSLRPSIHQLRASFKSIFETLIDNSFYEIPLSGLYTPMGEITV